VPEAGPISSQFNPTISGDSAMNTVMQPVTGSSTSADEMKAIVSELARVKSNQDNEAALSIYPPDAVLLSPTKAARSEGTKALRKALEAFFQFAPDYNVDLSGFAAAGDTLCGWGEIRFTPAHTFRGDVPNGARVVTPAFILVRCQDGEVIWESFHFDLADVARQVGVPAEAFQRAAPGQAV
jgi:predicted ester cyclase